MNMRRFLIILFLCTAGDVSAQTITVSPSDVNAYSQGATSVLLTFGGLVFGGLPARYDQSTFSGNRAFTDIMSVTPQVARRAYLDAVRGNTSTFFYVRRFTSTVGARDEYVPVTIRLSGNGARVPLSLTEVKLTWGVGKPILFVQTTEKLPRFSAEITYTGTGRLKGRWELVKPGEAPPAPRDLLTEATLPIEERGTQKRYTEISRFNIYLPPTGKVILPGPEVWRVDESLNGLYEVLLRIEASDDKEADTNLTALGAGSEVVHGGAVAGFSLPVLKYYVSNGAYQPATPGPPASTPSAAVASSATSFANSAGEATSHALTQLSPVERAVLPSDKPLDFTWTLIDNAANYRLEVEDLEGHPIISAILTAGTKTYRAPSWLKDKVGNSVARWRIIAFDYQNNQLSQSDWRSFRLGQAVGQK